MAYGIRRFLGFPLNAAYLRAKLRGQRKGRCRHHDHNDPLKRELGFKTSAPTSFPTPFERKRLTGKADRACSGYRVKALDCGRFRMQGRDHGRRYPSLTAYGR